MISRKVKEIFHMKEICDSMVLFHHHSRPICKIYIKHQFIIRFFLKSLFFCQKRVAYVGGALIAFYLLLYERISSSLVS